jgi:hypothetical protein
MVTSTIILNDIFSQTDAGVLDSGSEEVELSSAANSASVLSNIAQVGIIASGVLYLVWFYKATQFSRHMGLPGRRSTGWAMAGWLIPVINFWFPYQSTKDLLPPGHDDLLPLLRRWWGLWIAMGLSSVTILAGAAVMPAVAWAMAVLGAALAIGATVSAQQVVTAIDEAQEQYLAQLRSGT